MALKGSSPWHSKVWGLCLFVFGFWFILQLDNHICNVIAAGQINYQTIRCNPVKDISPREFYMAVQDWIKLIPKSKARSLTEMNCNIGILSTWIAREFPFYIFDALHYIWSSLLSTCYLSTDTILSIPIRYIRWNKCNEVK